MNDLLKEAIADAKAVRETAIENAKLALEEAFTPKLQSMLSAKIQNEMEETEEVEETEELEETEETTDEVADSITEEDDELTEEEEVEEGYHEDAEEKEEAVEEEEVEEDLDLEAIIRELEEEEEVEEEEEESTEEAHHEDMHSEEEEAEAPKAEEESEEEAEEDEEEIDIEEVLKALQEEDEELEEATEEVEEGSHAELEEAYNVIKFLKDKINEVNLLNAKLLFSNKLFRAYNLNEAQKLKVIENFDRATTLREIKLVYTTIAESFGNTTKRTIKEGSASKAVASTAPSKEVISEGNDLADRFKKLAGLIN